jgi:cytochrome c-type biogenesis protein CcmH
LPERRRLRPAPAALGLALVLAAGTLAAQDFDRAEYQKAIETILCDCGCHPQSVEECACGRAAEMREEIASLIRQGKTGDEVIAQYVAEHGEQIRIAPTARGFNLVAWIGPGLGLLAASLAVVALLLRWKRSPTSAAEAGAPSPASPAQPRDEEYRRRLRDALESLE